MQHARRRLAILVSLLVMLITVSVTQARWQSGDIGFVNMERVCRDGALVSLAALSDGGADTSTSVGARRHDNLTAAPEPDKAFAGSGTPRPLSDYGPNIVAAPILRPITITSQSLAREAAVNRGNGAPDVVRNYGLGILPWSALQPPGTPVILVYRRSDSLDAGIAEEIVADCTIGGGTTAMIAASALPGAGSGIPPAQLSYQVADWPAHGLLLRDAQPLAPGTRFSAADLLGHPLTYASSRTRLGDLLPMAVSGTDLVSQVANPQTNTFSSNNPAISNNGRYVAFESLASTLVSGDTNNAHDIFVYDRQAAQTTRVSLSSAGAQADNSSTAAAISADGRYVAFQSSAANLVQNDTNNVHDIFVRDRQTSQTARVSVSSAGTQAQGASTDPSISADGRLVAFVSDAADLVSGDTGGHRDIFVRDIQGGQTIRVSVGPGSAQSDGDSDSPAISGNGRYIAFRSDATNLLGAGGDTNGASDIFVYDRQTAQTIRVSVVSGGAQAQGASTDPAISADGRYVAFASDANNLTATNTSGFSNIYVYDRQTGQTTWVSHTLDGSAPDAAASEPSISADGRYVAFVSAADNLVGYDAKATQDIFLYDRQRQTLSCLSVSAQGGAADSFSASAAISADGRFTAFESYATNLLPNPTDTHGDIYVRYHSIADIVVGLPYQIHVPLTRR